MNSQVNFSADGKVYGVISGGYDQGVITVFDASTDQIVWKITDIGEKCFAFSPDSKFMATVHNGITIFEIKTKKQVWQFQPRFEEINSVCFSPDGLKFAAAGEYETDWDFNDPDMTSLALWDLKTGTNIWEKRGGLYEKVIFSSDGTHLFTIGTAPVNRNETSSIYSFDVQTGKCDAIFRETKRLRFWDIDIAPDGNTLICSGGFYAHPQNRVPVILVDLTSETQKIRSPHFTYFTKSERNRFVGHSKTVHAVSISPTGKIAASASADGTVRIWDIATANQLHLIKLSTRNLKFTPQGEFLALLNKSELQFYDVRSWRKIKSVKIA